MTATAHPTAHLAHCARNPCTCGAEAVADQVRVMRNLADELELDAWPTHGGAENVFPLFHQAAKLRANADRLESRAKSERQTP